MPPIRSFPDRNFDADLGGLLEGCCTYSDYVHALTPYLTAAGIETTGTRSWN